MNFPAVLYSVWTFENVYPAFIQQERAVFSALKANFAGWEIGICFQVSYEIVTSDFVVLI